MASAAGITLPSMDGTLGVVLIGAFLSMGLWGMGTTQMIYYYDKFPKDQLVFKVLVALSFIFTTAGIACYDYLAYIQTVKAFTNPAILLEYPTVLKYSIIIGLFASQTAQIFFAIRVVIFSNRNIYLGIYLAACIISVFAVTVYQASLEVKITSYVAYEDMSASLFIGCFAVGAWTDVSLAASLVFLLYNRGRGGMSSTWNIIRRIIVYALSTFTLSFVLALASMITRAAAPTSTVWGLLAQLTLPVYMNSVLTALNSRAGPINRRSHCAVVSADTVEFAATHATTANISRLEMGSIGAGNDSKTFGSRAAIDDKGRAVLGDDDSDKVLHIMGGNDS